MQPVIDVPLNIPAKLRPLLFRPLRYKVAKGGRGSGKSWAFARALIGLAHSQPGMRILCTREIQKSIKDSVHRLLSDQIEALTLGAEFDIMQTEIRHKNGSLFLFAGLASNTVESIKSFEGVDVCWVEEAQTVSERSWSILVPTIRKEGSEIWVSFNPDLEDDPVYQRFVAHPPPDCETVTLNHGDNNKFPDVLRREMEHLYKVDPEAAAHVWGGQCRKNSSAQIIKNYSIEAFTPRPDLWDGPYHGLDFGFAQDPLVFVRVWVWEGTLYVEYDANGLEVPIEHTAALLDTVPNARDYVTRADCARPEMINHLIRNGYKRATACHKWPGCVEDRADYLRSFARIVLHPRCKLAALEFKLYSYKVDRLSGDVLPAIVDKHNNTIDAIAYALEPLIMGWAKKTPKRQEPDEFPGMHLGGKSWMGG